MNTHPSQEAVKAKKIKLTFGQYAIVDASDFEELNKYKWYASWHRCTKSYTAVRTILNSKRVIMSRSILNAPKHLFVDHKNRNTLDNRRSNLRLCTRSQNSANSKRQDISKSPYKGVTRKKWGSWVAQIGFKGTKYHIGSYATPEQAARAYNKKCIELFGEFARPNKIKRATPTTNHTGE